MITLGPGQTSSTDIKTAARYKGETVGPRALQDGNVTALQCDNVTV